MKIRPSRLLKHLAVLLVLFLQISRCTNEPARIVPAEPYREAVETLRAFIEYEMADKALPALSIVLVDDQKIVWAEGFGVADRKTKNPATANTVYRIGSVSKLFTDIGIMQLVEQGKIDLDAPVTNCLPDLQPRNPYDKPITLRQLMSHRSGLLREPRVGNYFEDTEPTLAQTIASLNNTDLIYEPETRIKYSNAGIAVVGYTLEVLQGQPFVEYMKQAVLQPMGLKNSAFEPEPHIVENLAKAYMWSYDGREFQAPTFELGISPAGSMYAPVTNLGRFLTVLFNGGQGPNGRVLKPETLKEMWTPQFDSGPNRGYGIGFAISEQQGYKRVGHGGAIYGFATQLYALPEMKLGAAAVTTVDVANAVTRRITAYALDLMLSVQEGRPLPPFSQTTPVSAELAHTLEGQYTNGTERLKLIERNGVLILDRLGREAKLKSLNDSTLIVDDRIAYGLEVQPRNDNEILISGRVFRREPDIKPVPCPQKWLGLIGEYGWDHEILYIYEDRGQLYVLIEWFDKYPLQEIDANTFAFPNYGLYHGEKLRFHRNEDGSATEVEIVNSVVFKRRQVGTTSGETFRITPVKPVEALRPEALAATPPIEQGEFRSPELIELTTLDNTIKRDIRYATKNNFMGAVFYNQPKAFMQKPAAEALVRAHDKLKGKGFGLLIHDTYRPWYVTKMFWDATPDDLKIFVANPKRGSRHNRGCAVDLTLYNLQTGQAVEMVGGYDEFSERSFADYVGGTDLQRWHRKLLRDAMEAEGFKVYKFEWWHFDYKDWRQYTIQNLTFEEIPSSK